MVFEWHKCSNLDENRSLTISFERGLSWFVLLLLRLGTKAVQATPAATPYPAIRPATVMKSTLVPET